MPYEKDEALRKRSKPVRLEKELLELRVALDRPIAFVQRSAYDVELWDIEGDRIVFRIASGATVSELMAAARRYVVTDGALRQKLDDRRAARGFNKEAVQMQLDRKAAKRLDQIERRAANDASRLKQEAKRCGVCDGLLIDGEHEGPVRWLEDHHG